MKKFLFAALLLCTTFAVFGQDYPTLYNMNTVSAGDTARGALTKIQTKKVTGTSAITIATDAYRLTDTMTVTASVWATLDGVKYEPFPGADSVTVTLSASQELHKMWFLSQLPITNQVAGYQIRYRAASNTTNATSKAIVSSRLYTYK